VKSISKPNIHRLEKSTARMDYGTLLPYLKAKVKTPGRL